MNKTFFVKNTHDDFIGFLSLMYIPLCSFLLFAVSRQAMSFAFAEIVYIIVSFLFLILYEIEQKVGYYITGSEIYFQGYNGRKYINIDEIAGIKITPEIKSYNYGHRPKKLGGQYCLEMILLKEVTDEMWNYTGDYFYDKIKPDYVGFMNYDKEVLDHLCSIKPDIKVIPWFTCEK